MANGVTQNPANKWGRYSGGGAGGVSEVIPTQAEAERGLQPFSLDEGRSRGRALSLLLTAAVSGVVAAVTLRRARRPLPLRQRVMKRVGLN